MEEIGIKLLIAYMGFSFWTALVLGCGLITGYEIGKVKGKASKVNNEQPSLSDRQAKG